MREPKVRVLRRLLRLRQLPLFETVDLDELAMIAENVVETRIPAGTVVASAGARIHDITMIVTGHIEMTPGGSVLGPRQVHGALEAFANRPAIRTAIAATDVHVFQLSPGDLGDLLEDNFGVLVATLRDLARRLLATASRAQRPHGHDRAERLGLVERLILLRQQPPFASARLTALAALAHASEEVEWPAGTVVVHAGALATDSFIVLEGEAIRGPSRDSLRAGASIGQLEVLASAPHTTAVETVTAVRALRTTATALLDVLEDHTDIGLAMLAALAGELLDSGPTGTAHEA